MNNITIEGHELNDEYQCYLSKNSKTHKICYEFLSKIPIHTVGYYKINKDASYTKLDYNEDPDELFTNDSGWILAATSSTGGIFCAMAGYFNNKQVFAINLDPVYIKAYLKDKYKDYHFLIWVNPDYTDLFIDLQNRYNAKIK